MLFKRAVHPGKVLKCEIAELGISATEMARQLDVPANRITQIIGHRLSISCDTALRLGHWFGIDPQFWLNLQNQFDLIQATEDAVASIDQLPTRPVAGKGQMHDWAETATDPRRASLSLKQLDVADHPRIESAASPQST